MPKVVRDEQLAARVRAFIKKCGSVSAAAIELDVDRTLLWRFNRSGCAIERTRALLAAGLEQHEKETAIGESATSAATAASPASVPVEDLIAMRAFLQNMLNVIDTYVGSPAGGGAAAGFAQPIAGSNVTRPENMPMIGGQNGQS